MQWFHRRSTKCGRGRRRRRRRRRRTNSARISHPPPFRRVTKNENMTNHLMNYMPLEYHALFSCYLHSSKTDSVIVTLDVNRFSNL